MATEGKTGMGGEGQDPAEVSQSEGLLRTLGRGEMATYLATYLCGDEGVIFNEALDVHPVEYLMQLNAGKPGHVLMFYRPIPWQKYLRLKEAIEKGKEKEDGTEDRKIEEPTMVSGDSEQA